MAFDGALARCWQASGRAAPMTWRFLHYFDERCCRRRWLIFACKPALAHDADDGRLCRAYFDAAGFRHYRTIIFYAAEMSARLARFYFRHDFAPHNMLIGFRQCRQCCR